MGIQTAYALTQTSHRIIDNVRGYASRVIATGLRLVHRTMPPSLRRIGRQCFLTLSPHLPVSLRQSVQAFANLSRSADGELERSYAEWIAAYDTLDERARSAIQAHIATFGRAPLISIIMPVFNPALWQLEAAISSINGQLYPAWQLCIADDASTDQGVLDLLRKAAADDSRIEVAWRSENGGISAASNSALALARGEFVALVDHDDMLPPHALYEVARQILDRPDADILFSDEDHIDERGQRSAPYFKPGWNPELMLGQNLISHLGVYRRNLVERLGGFRIGLEGSQDYDLALRAIAATGPEHIIHIPRILYHWRRTANKTSVSDTALDRCAANGRAAVGELVRRSVPDAVVAPAPAAPYWNRVIYPVPDPEPHVSIIIPTRNGADLLRRTLDGLLNRTLYNTFEVIIVDNGSDEEESRAFLNSLRGHSRIQVLSDPGPFNYSALNNRAVERANGSLILLLNNDIDVINGDWLREMVSHAIRPQTGAVGAKLIYPNGRVQHGGVTIGMGGVAGHQYVHRTAEDIGYRGHLALVRNVSAVTGACLMTKRATFLEVGGLNEASLPVAFNDIDFCLRLTERGYLNVWTPFAQLYHYESASRGNDLTGEKLTRFRKECEYMRSRWGAQLDNDPYWNPNLSLNTHDVALAFPPRNLDDWSAFGNERRAVA